MTTELKLKPGGMAMSYDWKKYTRGGIIDPRLNYQTLMDDDWCETRIDPYLIWADSASPIYLEKKESDNFFPVMIELAETSRWRSAAEFAQKAYDESWGWIQVPAVYREPAVGLGRTRFFTARVTKDFFVELGNENTLKGHIERFELGLPVIGRSSGDQVTEDSGSLSPAADAGPEKGSDGAPRTRVIVAVIDDGLAFLHERFRLPDDKTRILYFWDQNEPKKNQEIIPELETVPGFGYGYELDWKAIEQKIVKNKTASGTFDEVAGYRLAGYENVNRRFTHGTHVMDLACGENPNDVPEEAPHIICVQIRVPSRTTRDTSGRWLGVQMLDGLRYILDRADKVAGKNKTQPIPVVVNLSFGNLAGPHDGSSILESAIDELITQCKESAREFSVVIAAGNHHLARCHACFSLQADESKEISWRIPPDDATPSFLEIWLPKTDSEGKLVNVEIEVEPPGRSTPSSGWIRPGACRTCNPSDDKVLSTVVYLPPHRIASGDRGMILVAVAPTTSDDPKLTIAPSGTWKIRLKNMSTAEVDINAWIQRDETPRGLPRLGRQSYFEDPNYKLFDSFGRLKEDDDEKSYIKRAGTLNAIATGKHTVVIGGYRLSDGEPAWYSARGMPTADGPGVTEFRTGPDAMAESEHSVIRHGVIAAGTKSGSAFAMQGTSVAAPQVARWIAKKMYEQQVIAEQMYKQQKSPKNYSNLPDWRDKVRKLAEQADPAYPLEGAALHFPKKNKPNRDRGGAGRLRFRKNEKQAKKISDDKERKWDARAVQES